MFSVYLLLNTAVGDMCRLVILTRKNGSVKIKSYVCSHKQDGLLSRKTSCVTCKEGMQVGCVHEIACTSSTTTHCTAQKRWYFAMQIFVFGSNYILLRSYRGSKYRS